jgi:hypothetical protein
MCANSPQIETPANSGTVATCKIAFVTPVISIIWLQNPWNQYFANFRADQNAVTPTDPGIYTEGLKKNAEGVGLAFAPRALQQRTEGVYRDAQRAAGEAVHEGGVYADHFTLGVEDWASAAAVGGGGVVD